MFVKVKEKPLMDTSGNLNSLHYIISILLNIILIILRVGGRESHRPHKPKEARALLVPATKTIKLLFYQR